MKRYLIFRDSTLVDRATARKRALAAIRGMQEQETHYLLRSEFSIIYGEEETVPLAFPDDTVESSCASTDASSTGQRVHILMDGAQYGSAPTRELALYMIQQAREHRADAVFTIIQGKEEFIRYPKRCTKKSTCA